MHGDELGFVSLKKGQVAKQLTDVLFQRNLLLDKAPLQGEVIECFFELCVCESKKNFPLLDVINVADTLSGWKLDL